MDRSIQDEVAAVLKAEHRAHLTLSDLFQLLRRGNVMFPIDPTHLGCLWVLDRCPRHQTLCLARRRSATAASRGAQRALPRPVLCRNHSGRITLDDLAALLELCRSRAREYQSFECEAMLQGYCTLQMWRAMSAPDGRQQFAAWCGQL